MGKKHNIITVIDGCQAAPHIPIDLQELGCDFYVFWAQIIWTIRYWVLYGKKNILEGLDPYQTGGEMIDFVSIEKSTYAPLPHKFEAGTQI